MFRDYLLRVLIWLWDRLDTVLALLLAAACSILGLLGVASPSLLASATLATLTILAVALMRNRSEREKTQNRLDQLLSQFNDPLPDAFFKYATDESPLLQDAEREVWMVQETGNLISEKAHTQIISFLRRGGVVRIVVATPTEVLLQQLAFRNLLFTSEDIRSRSKSFRSQIESISRSVGSNAERMQVRYTPYTFGALTVFVDPRSEIESKRKAVIRYAGFRLTFNEELDFSMQCDKSPRVYSHYFLEAQQLFGYASKIILLTGEPLCGKTTLISNLVNRISSQDKDYVFSVISRTLWDGKECAGFEVITSGTTEPRSFGMRRGDGTFDLDMTVWTSIAAELEQAYKNRRIIVLDEIGPMQLQNQAFVNVVEKFVNDPTVTMFATVAMEDRKNVILGKLKLHYRSTVLALTQDEQSRIEIEKNLEQEMESSLYVAAHIPNTIYELP